MRIDLPDPRAPEPESAAAIAEQLSVLCSRRRVPAVMAVAVEDRIAADELPPAVLPPAVLPHAALLQGVRNACEEVGTEVIDAHTVARLHTGERWRSYGKGETRSGLLPDPRCSVVSAAHVAQGRIIHGARSELEELFRPDTAARIAHRTPLVDAARDAAQRARERTGARAVREDLEAVLAAVARIDQHEGLFDEEIAQLGAALSDPLVRDACCGLAVGEHAEEAQALWLALCRTLPDPERAEPAVLVAYSCYVRGEGPLAGIALHVALTSCPGHRMATLLDTALAGGLPPEVVRELADTSLAIATDLGVALAPFTPRPPAPG